MISLAILFVYFTLLAWKRTRCLAFYMLPWVIFGLCYDVMRFYPNYKVNPIDIKNIYNTEKELFGITTSQGILIPGEWFKLHTSSFSISWLVFSISAGYRCHYFFHSIYFTRKNTIGRVVLHGLF